MKTKQAIVLAIQVIIVMVSILWTLLSIGAWLFPNIYGKGYIGTVSGLIAYFAARWIVKPIK